MRSPTTAGPAIRPRPRSPELALVAGALLAAGCSLMPAAAPPVPFAALPPASYGGSAHAEQVLSLSRAGTSTTLQCFVDLSPEKISVIGVTALGQRVLSFSYDAQGLLADQSPAQAEQVLRDLQLVTWPLAALQQAVAGTHWRIEEPRAGTRQVWRDDVLADEIRYAGNSPLEGHAWLVNLDARYTLDVESKALH